MNQELIYKYLKGEALPEEKLEILQWIEKTAENRKQFMQLRRLYDTAIWCENEADATKQKTKAPRLKPLNIFFKDWMKVAAVIAIAVGGTLFVQKVVDKPNPIFTQTIEVPMGQRVHLTLSDGTKVSLNSNSKFQFPSTFDAENRTVVLDGEGYFEVTHNARQPFHVRTQKCDIKVLGTTFNVLAYNHSDIFETSLLKGSVCISDLKTSQKIMLKPNERVQMENGKLLASRLESEDGFLWRDGIYVFKNEPLVDLFKKLEQYYQIQIIVRNKDIHNFKCTGKFRQKEGIDHVIKVLKYTNDFDFQRDEENNTVVIY